jgi:hypothetical protein
MIAEQLYNRYEFLIPFAKRDPSLATMRATIQLKNQDVHRR